MGDGKDAPWGDLVSPSSEYKEASVDKSTKLSLSTETLRSLDEQDLAQVVGGHKSAFIGCSVACVSTVCHNKVISVVCLSVLCF